MSSEENVWTCLIAYNRNSADEISAQYQHNKALILGRLQSYTGKNKYHGHITGGDGDAEHTGAAEARAAALAHLRGYTPPKQTAQIVKVADKAKKNANLETEGKLLKIIRDHKGNIPELEGKLTKENGNWSSIRNVNNSFKAWRSERKSQFGSKKMS